MVVDTEVLISPKDLPLSKWQPREGEIKLFHPDFEGLSYGVGVNPGEDMIQFGPKGGFARHEWVGSASHPLLEGLFAAYPTIIVEGEDERPFPCGNCSPITYWPSLKAFQAHNRIHRSNVTKTAVEGPDYQTSDDGKFVTVGGQRYARVDTPSE
jgi:hypothetical protein